MSHTKRQDLKKWEQSDQNWKMCNCKTTKLKKGIMCKNIEKSDKHAKHLDKGGWGGGGVAVNCQL